MSKRQERREFEKEQPSEVDIAKRRDDAIRRALNTPPQPRKDMPKRRPKAKADGAGADPEA